MTAISLPIDALLPQVCSEILRTGSVILQADPGAGKTTRVPPALLKVVQKGILVLEPRRLAARLSAQRIAAEFGEPVGKTVGYQVRFESAVGAQTRIRFITDGLFLRYFLKDPQLSEYECIILDEFHERHLHTDVALALIRSLQKSTRPDLKLIVMSATLNTNLLENYIPEAKIIISKGQTYPVLTEHTVYSETRPLELAMAHAIEQLCFDPRCPGHILAFLPGAAEIKRTASQLVSFAEKNKIQLFELKADMSTAEQQKVFAETSGRKIILSTNVAETSLTINGVTGVVDSGLAKISGHAPWSGMPTLDTRSVSQASCIQRSGRAGRTAPGISKRIFTLQDFHSRPKFEKAEITRLDLSQIILELAIASKRLGQNLQVNKLPWFESPAQANVEACTNLLTMLGALDTSGNPTSIGEKMAEYPLHPRLSRVILQANGIKKLGPGLIAASLINEGMIFKRTSEPSDVSHCDVDFQARIFQDFITNKPIPSQIQKRIDPAGARRVEDLLHSLCTMAKINFEECLKPFEDNAINAILLSGFPDRVAQVRKKSRSSNSHSGHSNSDSVEVILCSGGTAIISPQSVVKDSEFLIAIEGEELRTGINSSFTKHIRVASGINKDSLLLGSDFYLRENTDFEWDSEAQRVRGFERTYYGSIIVEQIPVHRWDNQFEDALIKSLRNTWPLPFADTTAMDFYSMRCQIIKESGFQGVLPDFSKEDFELLLMHICEGKKSYSEITARELGEYMQDLMSNEAQQALNDLAPAKITIGSGQRVVVHYEPGKPPWIESRLQDFFGSLDTPRVGRPGISLILHLLAPNGTALQVTQDLKGFWERVYPAARKELSRKYPRHSWPEDPKTALPPEPRAGRRQRKN